MLDAGQPERASERLQQALDLWTGPPLADVTQGRLLSTDAVRLQEQRMRALELRIQADVQLGRDRDLIGELRSLVARYPLHEWFHGQLIETLHRAGRRCRGDDGLPAAPRAAERGTGARSLTRAATPPSANAGAGIGARVVPALVRGTGAA